MFTCVIYTKESYENRKETMVALIVFGLFAVGFTGWIFNRSMGGERVSFNNTVRLETEADTAGEIKTKNLVLPEEFDIPRSLLFKTTHTSVQILLDGEEIYQYGHEENAPKFMKSPGSAGILQTFPRTVPGKNWKSVYSLHIPDIMETTSAFTWEPEETAS